MTTRRRSRVPVQDGAGMAQKKFTVYRTHHGPIVREADGKWVSVRLMQEPIKALTQSYTRTKATSYKAFRDTMELHTNSSNNTIFADADGDIAYFHAQLHPEARSEVRLDEAGRRQRSGDGVEGSAVGRRDAAPAQSGERLALQLEQLAVVRRRSEQSEEGGLSRRTSTRGGEESARGLHALTRA